MEPRRYTITCRWDAEASVCPFSANLAGIAMTAFALALFSRDGFIAIVAAIFSIGAIALIVNQLI